MFIVSVCIGDGHRGISLRSYTLHVYVYV